MEPEIYVGHKMLLVWRCPLQEEKHIGKDEKLLVVRGAKKYEQCRDEVVMLLIRMGYKMLLVWRCAPQEEEHIEKMRCCWLGEVLKKRSNVDMKMRRCWSGLDIRCCWSGDVLCKKRST